MIALQPRGARADDEPDLSTPAAAQSADPSSAEGEAAAGGDRAKQTHWAHAPVKWWGSTGSRLMKSYSSFGPGSTGTMQDVQLNASSYIWQPWFALVNGGLGFNSTGSKSYQTASKSVSVTGNGNIVLFPQSRFPFQANYAVADSRASQDLIGTTAYTSSTFYAAQNYTPQGGRAHYNVDFTRSSLDGDTFGRDTQTSLSGTMNHDFDDHRVQINAVDTTDTRKAGTDRSSVRSLSANHSYVPQESTLSVTSLATVNQSDLRTAGADNMASFVQAMSFATWRPEEESPWMLTGSLRAYGVGTNSNNGVASVSNKALGYGGSLGTSYDWSKNLRFNANGNLGISQSGSARSTTGAATGGGSYNSDPIPFQDFIYTWSVSGSGGTQFSSTQTGQQGASSQSAKSSNMQFSQSGNHSLQRDFGLNDVSKIIVRLVEGVNLHESNLGGNGASGSKTVTAYGLQHSASTSWIASTEELRMMASISFGDSRNNNNSVSDQFSMQLSVDGNLSRNSSASGSLSAQKSIQHNALLLPAVPLAPAGASASSALPSTLTNMGLLQNQSTSVNADLTYINSKAFGIPRLQFKSILRGNTMLTEARFNGVVGAPAENVMASWDNLFSYSVGNLTFSALARVARISGKNNGLIFFSMRRQLRGVL